MLDQVASRIRTIPMADRKTGYFASPQRTFQHRRPAICFRMILCQRAGIINVAHDLNGYFQDISPEQFIAWNPDSCHPVPKSWPVRTMEPIK